MRCDLVVLSVSVAFTCACNADVTAHSGAGATTSMGGGVSSSGGASSGGTSAGGTSAGGTSTAGSGGTGNTFSGGDCPAELGFPAAEVIPNVRAEVSGTTARILFDPRAGAKDYRVFLLPQAGDISGDTVANATYRCAGIYEVPPVLPADSPTGNAIRTVLNGMVQGYQRSETDTTLGYVFTTPGDDRIAVYAMGDSNPKSDNVICYEPRWVESRVKKFTTSADERAELRTQHWRDDGIVFYVPKPDAAGTTPLYRVTTVTPNDWDGALYVSSVGAEYTARTADTTKKLEPAFSVYSEAQPGSEPLKRIHYTQACARSHDELIAGEGRFEKAMTEQGAAVQELHFSGITEGTKLVVEALDSLCPFQGVVSPMSRPARDDPFGDYTISYPQFLTPDEIRATSPSGELFIDGQGDGGTPHAIARACLTVSPSVLPPSDWSYDSAPETYSTAEQAGFQIWTMDSPTFDFQIHTIATDEWGIGSLFGELWLTYADWASDTNGKMRITPKTKGSMAASQFLYATMQVDAVSSDRRYPQLF
ncbi:MAG TPA: hypothetical protein VGP93_08760, partial [Polyangiaceae bacterium]|nr:hypothetical protein [Polyangiaceae bacterium]